MLPDAAAPEGVRLYVVGDVHGCLDRLHAVEALIDDDLAADPPAAFHTVMLGDYIDRGPDSRGVLAWLVARAERLRLVALKGNHEDMLEVFLADPDGPALPLWMTNGGQATVASFEVGDVLGHEGALRIGPTELRDRLRAELDGPLEGVLDRLRLSVRFGDYLFVHAGVRPGVPLEAQAAEDLVWIREPFLGSGADHGAVVVHGHTPTREVVVRRNRIGLDTGAVFGGALSCLVLEGRGRWLLRPGGRAQLATP